MVRRSKRNRDAGISADDGNAMGLTEAFHPVSADGFTTAMPPVDEGDGSVVGHGRGIGAVGVCGIGAVGVQRTTGVEVLEDRFIGKRLAGGQALVVEYFPIAQVHLFEDALLVDDEGLAAGESFPDCYKKIRSHQKIR